MKKIVLLLTVLFFTGCTQVITAPIYVAGAIVETTIDVTGAAVGAVVGDDDEEKEQE